MAEPKYIQRPLSGCGMGLLAIALLSFGCGSKNGRKGPPGDVTAEQHAVSDTAARPDRLFCEVTADVRPGVPDIVEVNEFRTDSTLDVVPADAGFPLPSLPDGPAVLMHLGPSAVLPFPWNWYTSPDDSSPTGLRLSMFEPEQSSVIIDKVLKMIPNWGEDAQRLDGFGAIGLVVLPVATDMDPESLPDKTGPGQPVEVIRMSPEEGYPSVPLALSYQLYEDANSGELIVRTLELEPIYLLNERTSHLILVRRTLTDAEGQAFQPYPLARVILGLDEPYGPPAVAERMVRVRDETLQALADIPGAPPVEELAAAVLFTVGTMTADMFEAVELLEQEESVVDLDPDGDGVDNIFSAQQYFGSSPANVSGVVAARFKCPDFRDAGGHLGYDQDGKLSVHNFYWRDFLLVIPDQVDLHPFPVVTMQHGISSWKETEHAATKALATRGIATGVFDFMYHSKGSQTGGFQFVQIDSANGTVGNFRQSALDLLSFVKALEKLAKEHDLFPLEGEDGPDLRFERVGYLGHSLGALVSAIAAPLSTGDRVAGLVAGGGNFRYLFEVFLKDNGLWGLIPGDAAAGFKVLASHFMSRTDPAVFSRHMMLSPGPGRDPCRFLLLVGLEDGTIPPECGHALTVAAGSPLLEPFLKEWPWTSSSPAGDTTFGTIQFQAGHEFFKGGDGPEIKAAAQGVFYHYVETYLNTGQYEIVWP